MEAPENIGSALKSIISRYGEMTSDPTKLVDSEGEEMNLNKVDKALKSVGITLQDANGQFRNFDEVILELSSKWDTIDTNTQRYIATIMAGNRQQSRFLAMVGNYERLAELSEEAADSEDAALIQQLKTMDSIETKLNQMHVAFQEFYTSTGIEGFIKWILDFVTNIINSLNSMPKLFGKIPVGAIALVTNLISGLKKVATRFFDFAVEFGKKIQEETAKGLAKGIEQGRQKSENSQGEEERSIFGKAEDWLAGKIGKGEGGKKALIDKWSKGWQGSLGKIADFAGLVSTTVATISMDSNKALSGWLQIGGAAASAVGQFFAGNWVGAVTTAVTGIISGIDTLFEDTEEKIERLKKDYDTKKEEALIAKNEYKTLEDYRKKLEELNETRHESDEAYQEWINLNNEIVEKYPELLNYITTEGDKIARLGEEWSIANKLKKEYYDKTKEESIAALNYFTDENVKYSKIIEGSNPYSDTFGRTPSYNLYKSFIDSGINTFNGIVAKFDSFVTKGTATYQNTNSNKHYLTRDFFGTSDIKSFIDSNTQDKYDLDMAYNLMIETLYKISEGVSFEEINTFLANSELSKEMVNSGIGPISLSGDIYSSYKLLMGSSETSLENYQTQLESAISSYIVTFDEMNDDFKIESQLQLDSFVKSFSDSFQKWKESSNRASDDTIRNFLGKTGDLGEGDYLQYWLETQSNYEGIIQNAFKDNNSIYSAISLMIDEEKTELNSIYSSAMQYSLNQWLDAFKNILGEDIVSQNLDFLTEKYNEQVSDFYFEQISWFDELLKETYGKSPKVNLKGENFSSSTLQTFSSLIEAGLNKETIFNMAELINETAESSVFFSNTIAKYNLTTLSGILQASKILGKEGYPDLSSAVLSIIEEININLETEWRLFSESLVTSLESLNEALNKASSGMNLKEAQEMASKLGVSITDFELVDGQFFYHNLEVLKNAYLEQYATLRQQLKSETQSQIDSLGELSKVDKTSSIDESWSEENQTLFNTYFEDWKEAISSKEFTGTFYQYVVEQLRQMEQENLVVTDEYLRQQVAQITRERLEQIYDTISNGISGSMSEGEFSQLDYYLKENGHNFTLQTYETAEGLKLTEDSVLRVYEALKQTDSLAAQVVLDELTESAMEAEEKFNNIYEVLEHIAKINEEIAKAGISDARRKELERELILAENIRDTLMEAGNAFNFMNQDLPTGHTNPLSAWEGMNEAWSVLEGDDFKEGYIDYTDFYNMVNMMGDEGLEVAGLFNGKITTASQLMQAAGQALVRVDGKVFIDWTKLGEDFLGSAEGMKAGLDKGIKIIAEQQIKLLDAQIAMLEAAIALEEVNFDNDGIFKFDEIVNKEDGLFSSDSLKYLDFIKNYFGDYFIDGVPLMDALLTKLSPKELESFFTQLNHIFTNWDPNNIEASLESFNALMNQYFSGSITSGEATFGSIITPKYNFETEQMEYFINGVKVENEDYETLLSHLYKEDLDLTNYANKYGLIIPPADGGTLSTLLSFNSQVTVSFKDGETIYINKETGREFVNSANPDIALSWAYADYMESQYAKNTFSDAQLKPVPINGTQEILYSLTVNGKTEFYWRGRKFENQEEADEAIRKSLNIEKGFASSSGSSSSSSSSESPGYSYAATEELTLESGITVKVNRVIDEENSGETIGFIYEGNYYENETQLSEALAEKTPDLPETEVETSTKVVLKTDNITIGTENESGKAEIEIGEVIAHSSGVEISAKDGNVTFTVNGKEIEGPQFMAELGVVNLDNLNALIDAVEKLEVPSELAADLETIASKLKTLGESLSDAQVKRIGDLASNLSKIQTSTKTLTVELSVSSTGSVDVTKVGDATEAKGTVDNLSFATGNAKATGTLMGELGPELYVTGGRYYVAGQNGAEFVNLPSDAIVFNHLQTRRLLENGSINGTGKPVTNERNAVAMATGTTGPAMASAQETLDRLKEIRSLWQGLLDASSQNLGKKAGGSSGSGGEDDKAFMHELERWYNLLRQIAKLEQQITYEQAKRENMQSGYKHVQSLEKELALLKKQQAAHQELSKLQREYYDERRDVLKNTSYGKLIFTYDEDGLMQYIEEDGKGLDILAELEKTDENGKAVRNAQEQVAYLDRVGFDISTLLTNADGSKVKSNDYQTMMQIFWDGVDGWMAELDELYDSYNESMTSVEEAIQAQNEIMQEYIDNQLSVEERLMEAIVSREEAEIERLEKELDALDEATNKYLDGLKDSLDREKQMYERNKDSEETAKLQRQLAILKRTGGSASEIQSLQDEISSRLEDSYFQQQEDQIDALEQAANNQIEKLQTQIDIMNETLEYQKANGLLWEEVYEMMNNWSPEQMLQFIEEFLPSYRENSALQNDQNSQEALKEFEIWVAKRENAEALANAWQNYYDSVNQYSDEFKAEHAEGAKNAYSLAYATEGEDAAKKAADDYFAKQASLLNGSGGSGDEEKEEQPETGTTPVEGGGESSKKASQTNGEIKRGDKGEDVRVIQKALSSLGYYKGSIDGIFGETTQNAVYSFQKAMGIQADGIVGNKTREKFKLKGYKTGGLVDFTGPAWVDGTKTKPEAFLSAEDTAMLKSRIFDNNKYSLRSVIELFEGIGNSGKNITTNNDQGVVFENVQITIESGTIANDYDARRAGEMALEEMLKISRKTANRIVSRR